ncbi:MAG TPA: hypothetical protein VMM12_05260 [Longimicrobiales bacterium]|nr:hypothetical protein [Longimicrobiales bacterium]
MRRTLIVALGLAGLGGALAACGDEDPTGVGAELIGPGVTTFEVILDPQAFLQADTTYDSFGQLSDAGFRLVANQFAGELDAHTLFQIFRPFTVTYQPSDGAGVQTDSLLAIRGARVTLIVDSAASTAGPVDIEVLPVTETWDAASVTWSLRHDTAGVSEPWTTPGGTTGPAVGTATWTTGDTLVIPIDSASAAVWQDTLVARRGALVRTTTSGARLRLAGVRFEYDVVPREQPDTMVVAGSASRSMHIVSPDVVAPAPTELRVGGLPAWRSLLHFRRMGDIIVNACGGGGPPIGDPACDVALGDAALNLAAILLEPLPVGGRRIEVPIRIEAWRVLPTENVPVFRAPLSGPFGRMADSIPVELFTPTPPAGTRVAVPVTSYVRQLLQPEDPEAPLSLWVALVAELERGTFGYGAFSSMESAAPPRLRLILTIPNREMFE